MCKRDWRTTGSCSCLPWSQIKLRRDSELLASRLTAGVTAPAQPAVDIPTDRQRTPPFRGPPPLSLLSPTMDRYPRSQGDIAVPTIDLLVHHVRPPPFTPNSAPAVYTYIPQPVTQIEEVSARLERRERREREERERLQEIRLESGLTEVQEESEQRRREERERERREREQRIREQKLRGQRRREQRDQGPATTMTERLEVAIRQVQDIRSQLWEQEQRNREQRELEERARQHQELLQREREIREAEQREEGRRRIEQALILELQRRITLEREERERKRQPVQQQRERDQRGPGLREIGPEPGRACVAA